MLLDRFRVRVVHGLTPLQLMRGMGQRKGYDLAQDGTDKAPGLIGSGFGGEALVILKYEDDGQWVDDVVALMMEHQNCHCERCHGFRV